MQINLKKSDLSRSWTLALEASTFHEFIPDTLYPRFGVALLWYRPERRLSLSLWNRRGAKNVRLYGPRKLSWEN